MKDYNERIAELNNKLSRKKDSMTYPHNLKDVVSYE
jgi:hypothetical protein